MVYHIIGGAKGGVSGGTIDSAMGMYESEKIKEVLEAATDAYYLVPRERSVFIDGPCCVSLAVLAYLHAHQSFRVSFLVRACVLH